MYIDCIHVRGLTMSTVLLNSKSLRAENINLRASARQKALIDRAAEVQGRSRSDFNLDEDAFRRFMEMLDAPPSTNPGLARLLATKAPWDK